MSQQLGTVSCAPCCTSDTGETLVSYLAKTVQIAKLVNANFNTTADQAITLPNITSWILHRAFVVNSTGAIVNAVGGIYTGENKTGDLVVPATQSYAVADSSSYRDLSPSTFADSHVFTDGTVYLSLTTPEGSAVTGDLCLVFEDLDPVTLAVTANDCVKVVNIPGTKGDDGEDGTDGAVGANAYTATTQALTQPVADASVTITVADASWMAIGQIVYIQAAGWYEVQVITTNTVTFKNLDYAGNASPTTIIGSGAKVSPSGPEGSGGGSIVTSFDDLAPAGTAGTMLVHNGTQYAAFNAVLNNFRIPRIDTAQANKVSWDLINLSSWTLLGQLPVASGGTGGTSAATARTSLGAAASGANSDITSLTGVTSFKVGATGATITGILSATAVLDFPNTANNAASDLTITVTGAVVGDAVFIGLPAAPAAGVFFGWVSASNTVTIRFRNDSGGAVDPASATYRASVVRI